MDRILFDASIGQFTLCSDVSFADDTFACLSITPDTVLETPLCVLRQKPRNAVFSSGHMAGCTCPIDGIAD